MYVLLLLLCWAHALSASPSFMTSFPPLHFDFRSQLTAETIRQRDREKREKKRERKEKSCSSSTSFTFMPLPGIINYNFFKKKYSCFTVSWERFHYRFPKSLFFSFFFYHFIPQFVFLLMLCFFGIGCVVYRASYYWGDILLVSWCLLW